MAKKNNIFLIVIVLLVAVFFILPNTQIFGIAAGSTVVRTLPSGTVHTDETFDVIYTAVGQPNANWFVAWEDLVIGGCTPTNPKNFIIGQSDVSSGVVVTYTAPSTPGTCIFDDTAFYQFAGETGKPFLQQILIIDIACLTEADTNCDGIISLEELIAYANLWVAGSVTFTDLIEAASFWVTS